MSEEDFFNGAVLGPEDMLILRSRNELIPDVMTRIQAYVAEQGLTGRVLVVDGTVMDVGILRKAEVSSR